MLQRLLPLLFLGLVLSNDLAAQGEVLKSFTKSEGLCFQKIQLCKDHKVFLEKGCELGYKMTVGTWSYEGDTLIITPFHRDEFDLVQRVDGSKEKGLGKYLVFRFFDYFQEQIPFYPLPIYNQSEGYPVFKIQVTKKNGKQIEIPIDKSKEGRVKRTKVERIDLITLGEAYGKELHMIPKTEGKYNLVKFYMGLPASFISNPEVYYPMEHKLRFISSKDGLLNLANGDLEFKLDN